jgi:glycosidase
MTLEHLQADAAEVVNTTAATSYWDNQLYELCFAHLRYGSISPSYLGALSHIQFLNDAQKAPTLYLSNHDHSSVSFQAGTHASGPMIPDGAAEWWRTQPHAIALLTSPGSTLIPMGQEFAFDAYLPENDDGHRRVLSRPLVWKQASDSWGQSVLALYTKLIRIRNDHPALRSRNFYPGNWQDWMTQWDGDGYGVDVARGLVVYHRWGYADDGTLELFYIVLNFSSSEQTVRISLAEDGAWEDLLDATNSVSVVANKSIITVGSNWGAILSKRG